MMMTVQASGVSLLQLLLPAGAPRISPTRRQTSARILCFRFARVLASRFCGQFVSSRAPLNMRRTSDRHAGRHVAVASIAQNTALVATWRSLRMSNSRVLYDCRSCTSAPSRRAEVCFFLWPPARVASLRFFAVQTHA